MRNIYQQMVVWLRHTSFSVGMTEVGYRLQADWAPQTAVVISKTRPGFEPCTSWMPYSCFIYTPVCYSFNVNLLYFLFIVWVTCYGSVNHPQLPNTSTKYRRTLHLQNHTRCIRSLVIAISTTTASDAQCKMQRCHTCDVGFAPQQITSIVAYFSCSLYTLRPSCIPQKVGVNKKGVNQKLYSHQK